MKMAYLHANTLKMFFRNASFASFLTIASLTGAKAQKTADTSATAPASVSYLGYSGDQYSFLMKYENEHAEKFAVKVTDSDGNILYDEIFTVKKFSKVFKTHLETGSLTFVISNLQKKEEKKFKVNAERHLAEEFSITKSN